MFLLDKRMGFRYMMVQIIACGENLATVFTGPRERAGKVDVLDVLAHVDPLAAGLSAQDTPVMSATVLTLFNVGVKGSHTI